MGRSRRPSRSEVAGGGSRPPAALRYPKVVLALAAVAIVAFAIIGFGVEERLKPASLSVPGTGSAEANEILQDNFGETAPFAILLRGPATAVDRQGPKLIRSLRRDPDVTTLSPWDRGSLDPLRPSPRKALILVDFHVGINQAVRESVPRLEETFEEEIHPPVRATQTGFATLSSAIQEESIHASERGELIALPILLLVLLLVFRSPVAAIVPLIFGAVTVFTSRGILYFLTNWLDIDAFALTVCTMMGLALGVDYSLLMVSRFREELRNGTDPVTAAWTTRRTSGRTVVFAGSTLVLSMVVSLFIVPGTLLASLAGTLTMVTILSVFVATILGPALLILLNTRIDLWRFGGEPGASTGLMALVNAALRRPAAAAGLIGAIVLFLAAPALALKTGPPSVEQLPHDNQARIDAELISRQIGPGFDAPFTLVADVAEGTITEPKRLAAISNWQRRLSAENGVQAVIGPGQLARRVAPLRNAGEQVLASNSPPLRNLRRLGRQLGRAASGVSQLRDGVAQASYGAVLLGGGAGDAEEGAAALSNGLSQAGDGAGRAVEALNSFASGTRQLANGLRRLSLGTLQLKLGLRDGITPNLRSQTLQPTKRLRDTLREQAGELPAIQEAAQAATDEVSEALERLDAMTVGKTDPEYDAALDAVQDANAALEGLPDDLETLREDLLADASEAGTIAAFLRTNINDVQRLTDLAELVDDGTRQAAAGATRLAGGAKRLAAAATSLRGGLAALNEGAARLASGIGQLESGADQLAHGLSDGFQQTQPLQSGLRSATTQVISQSADLRDNIRNFNRSTPRFFDSGYFVLTAVDGAQKANREASERVVDLDGGGQAAAILVIPRYTFNTEGSKRLDDRLDTYAEGIARTTGAETGVAGGAAQLNDYNRVTQERIPWVVLAITIATFLILVLILRSIPLAALAVVLNLITVGVAFGVLTLLFEVPQEWPLGGRSYVDAIGAVMIFGVVFGLSIDYAVFLLMRMREHYDQHRDNAAAISFGLEKTARVITGAAAIMMGVFIAFAAAPVATVSQLGVGLTIAVLLDATVVRIVLLPALMLLMGDRVWWLPRWLDRALPKLNVEGNEESSGAAPERA